MSIRPFLWMSCVVATSSLACGSRPLPPPFALEWAGVESSPALTERGRAAFGPFQFKLEPTVDRRADPTQIGVDQESRYQYRTTTPVAQFTSERVRTLVEGAGVKLSDAGSYIVQSEIIELNVIEDSRFEGTVKMTFRVFTVGKPAYEATYVGKGSTFGRSHNPENINEVISAGILSCVSQFLHDEVLAKFLEERAGNAAPAGSAAPGHAPPAGSGAPAASAPSGAAPATSAAPASKPKTL